MAGEFLSWLADVVGKEGDDVWSSPRLQVAVTELVVSVRVAREQRFQLCYCFQELNVVNLHDEVYRVPVLLTAKTPG
jgi:hypothetical protein